MRTFHVVVVSMACATVGAMTCVLPAFGQTRDDLQPGVNTSAMPPQPAAPATMSAPRTGAAPAKPAAGVPGAAATSAKTGAAAAGAKSAHPGKAMDRLDLDTTQITGNKELPKVMYVVPWKHSDLGDLTGKPANSLVDEVLQPVDRDVFNREERYYQHSCGRKECAGAPGGSSGSPLRALPLAQPYGMRIRS